MEVIRALPITKLIPKRRIGDGGHAERVVRDPNSECAAVESYLICERFEL